jgi:hypothetical protein
MCQRRMSLPGRERLGAKKSESFDGPKDLKYREGHEFYSCRKRPAPISALAAEGHTSSLNPGNAEQ